MKTIRRLLIMLCLAVLGGCYVDPRGVWKLLCGCRGRHYILRTISILPAPGGRHAPTAPSAVLLG